MTRQEAVFSAERITPELAAELVRCASRYPCRTMLEKDGTSVVLGSLIGVLSLDLSAGARISVLTEGEEEGAAAAAVCALLTGGGVSP